MKKSLLFVLMFLSNFSFTYAQKLKVNEVDKFSKEVKQETAPETLYGSDFFGLSLSENFQFYLRKIDDSWAMPASITLKEIEKYDKDSGIILLLSNGETITLNSAYTGIGAEGDTRQHLYSFDTCFNLSKDDIQKLSNNDVTDIRINYLGGSYDRKIKGKKTKLIRNMIKLFH